MKTKNANTISIDIPELNRWKKELGWSNKLLAKFSGVSERTIERIYEKGTTSRDTYARLLDSIQQRLIAKWTGRGFEIDSVLMPHSLELEDEETDGHQQSFGGLDDGSELLVRVAVGAEELEITIDGDIDSFSPTEKDEVLRHIQSVLDSDTPPSVIRYRRGSIKITIRVTPEQSEKLKWAIKSGQLEEHGIVDAEQRDSTNASIYKDLIRHSDAKIRIGAIESVVLSGNERQFIPSLISCLNDEDKAVSAKAIKVLTSIGGDAVPELVECLADDKASIRAGAANVLGGLGAEAEDTIPALIELLKDGEVSVRITVVKALRTLGEEAKNAIPALIECLKDLASGDRNG